MLAIVKEQCLLVLLLVILNLKKQSPPDQKHVLYQLLQLGQSSFDSIVVCWLNFESAIPARAFAWFRKTKGFIPAEGLFQPGRFPAPGWFQPRAFSSLGLLPARGIVQQRVCSRQKLVKNILGMFRVWVFSSSSLVPAPGCFQRGVVSTSELITPQNSLANRAPAPPPLEARTSRVPISRGAVGSIQDS